MEMTLSAVVPAMIVDGGAGADRLFGDESSGQSALALTELSAVQAMTI